MSTPRVSVCLPTWNGERDLARLLPALSAQRVAGGVEVVAIDSSSTDRTRELLAAAGARVEVIAQREFGHGRTRNALARLARGEHLVFLSQDALPEGADFVATLAGALDDPRTAGAYARILPHDDDDPLTKRTALDAPEASSEARSSELRSGVELRLLDPREAMELARFNDVASCVRRSTLLELPFPDVAFGEDVAWAARALDAGWRLRFEPRALVRHAHRYGSREAFERYRIDAAFQREQWGIVVRPTTTSMLKGFVHELRRDVGFVAAHGGWSSLLRAPSLRLAQVRGQRAGSRGVGGR